MGHVGVCVCGVPHPVTFRQGTVAQELLPQAAWAACVYGTISLSELTKSYV